MADGQESGVGKEDTVTSMNNHDVNNHDVNNHCAIEIKEDQASHTESNDSMKEVAEENNHVAAVLPSSCEEVSNNVVSNDALLVKNSCDDASDSSPATNLQPDVPSAFSNISDSHKDRSYSQDDSTSQNDSGVRVDIESELSDIKDLTSSSKQRTSSSGVGDLDSEMAEVEKTADKLDSACSMIPNPDSSSDPNQHSDCSSSSRSSKEMFMDAQEDLSNDSFKNASPGAALITRKDDSGIDIGKSPEKSSLPTAKSPEASSSTDDVTAIGGPTSTDKSSLNSMTDQIEEFYSSLPPGTSTQEKPSIAEHFVADFDTSSETGDSCNLTLCSVT